MKYVIIGAGPTGLGAAHRLLELGERDFVILERDGHAGGLAASFRDSAGFTWDIGGHVVFSRYEYFNSLLDDLLGGERLEHQRIARVRMADTWVPYPFQNNIRHLPRELVWECVQGLLRERSPQLANFSDWIDYVFGAGIARLFMRPYNFKVWATPPELMQYSWIGERVSVVDLEGVLKNLILGLDDAGWGPNNTFRFPLHGGTGDIFNRLAASAGGHLRLNAHVVRVDLEGKTVELAGGERVEWEYLLNTGPLDRLVQDWIRPESDELHRAAADLEHNSVFVSGVGVDGLRQDPTCWMYFPESNCPFYRVTNFHNYSPNNVAMPGSQMGFMSEVSSSRRKPENLGGMQDKVIDGLKETTLVRADDAIVSTWEMNVDYGYPVPTLGRDRALGVLQPWLEERRVFSRGRFGGWKYEVANMDHSVMQGVEWVERMVQGREERTYRIG
ncbi:MAG: amine oxidase [Deltaproteobacteria bacterium HGW-Deltaproteobacteria-18]|nr:MAG: amine oxidase [Deltaproteobacteria bacterium HGW-Deltaproteobacteria-18]